MLGIIALKGNFIAIHHYWSSTCGCDFPPRFLNRRRTSCVPSETHFKFLWVCVGGAQKCACTSSWFAFGSCAGSIPREECNQCRSERWAKWLISYVAKQVLFRLWPLFAVAFTFARTFTHRVATLLTCDLYLTDQLLYFFQHHQLLLL